MSKIKIGIATHKKYRMPDSDIYLPIQVGAAGKSSIGCQRDDIGDNISCKNKNFCELTGLYWMWKNMAEEYVGLVHYRRHFFVKRSRDKWESIAGREEIEKILLSCDVILPKKRDYVIETTYNQYAHAHHAQDLDETRRILEERYPAYVDAFDACMARTDGHKFNMFIMKKDRLDAYCEWLFDILFELEQRLDLSGYSQYDRRVFGFVAERLLDVWIETNQVAYTELPVVFMEKQNWVVKGGRFLMRKIFANAGGK